MVSGKIFQQLWGRRSIDIYLLEEHNIYEMTTVFLHKIPSVYKRNHFYFGGTFPP